MFLTLRDKKLFLFDFDGTLVDTSAGILASLNHTRKCYGLSKRAFAQVKQYIGTGLQSMLNGTLREKPEISGEEAARIYRAHHETNMYEGLAFYPGIREFLTALNDRKKLLGIVSNKNSYFIIKILEKLNSPVNFDIIVGADTLPEHKPQPRPLLYACEELGCVRQEAVMFGDSIYDIEAGLAAGICTVGCAWGFNGAEPFKQIPPDLVIQNIQELLPLLTKS
ncbi:MAG: HAD-IA family hydrolase [Candidatus Margulisbacteria bacterium]|jgi:phosphoglycolate phosphatase|nr:HAD-IA family hydrolase [Candidatus Margulisiibacteriota bacterium]